MNRILFKSLIVIALILSSNSVLYACDTVVIQLDCYEIVSKVGSETENYTILEATVVEGYVNSWGLSIYPSIDYVEQEKISGGPGTGKYKLKIWSDTPIISSIGITGIGSSSSDYKVCDFAAVAFEITDSSDDVIEDDIDMTVGEQVILKTKILPEELEASLYLWLFDEVDEEIVAGYSSGEVTYFDDYESDQIQFYWVEGGEIDLTVGSLILGEPFIDTVTFNVARPSINYSSTSLGDPMIYYSEIMNTIGGSVTVKKNSSSNGTIKIVQLIKEYIEVTKTTGPPYIFALSIEDWWLDTVDPYNGPVTISSTQASITHIDHPGVELNQGYEYVEVDHQEFETFVMYQSSEDNSIWVPVGKMTWDWHGDAQVVDEAWELIEEYCGHDNPSPAWSSTTDFPEWTNTATTDPMNPNWQEKE